MPSLLEALSDGSFDMLTKHDMSSGFSQKLRLYKDVIISEYLKYNIDLNIAIAKIAEKNNLNDDQIQRIVEEVNNQVYLVKYSKLKDSTDRDVEFDLASVPKIREIIGKGETKKSVYNDTKEASKSTDCIEKKASIEDEDGDKLNAWNYDSHQFSSLSSEIGRSRDSILAEKIASTIVIKENEFKIASEKLASDVYTVAETLIKYDRFGIDVQEVYEEMCKSANILKSDQIMYKNAIEQKVSQMKEYNQLPSDYNFNVELCDNIKVANEFSLGKNSFIKQASEKTQSNQNLPVVTSNKKVIRSVNDLINMAQDIQSQKIAAKVKFSECNSIREKSANMSMSDLEKVAQSGIVAFGKAALGITKSKAFKELGGASKELENVLNNPKMINAKNEVANLENSVKDISSHLRMSGVKSELSAAKDNLNKVRQNGDSVLNEAATQGPIKRLFNSGLKETRRDIKEAKHGLSNAQKKYDAQGSRINSEIGSHLEQANNRVHDVGHELGISDAEKKVEETKAAYNKATRSASGARTVLAVGATAPVVGMSLNEQRKKNAGSYSYQ